MSPSTQVSPRDAMQDGIAATVNGLEDVSKMPSLIVVLLRRGYTESDLKKILGENFLRVVREVVG